MAKIPVHFCRRHWYSLPQRIQNAIFEDVDELNGLAIPGNPSPVELGKMPSMTEALAALGGAK